MSQALSSRPLFKCYLSCAVGVSLLICVDHALAQTSPAPTNTTPVVVSGVVPDEASRQAILSKLRDVYGHERVVDQLGVANIDAPPNWADYVQKLVTPDLKNIHRGELKITGNTVQLSGEVDSNAARDRIGAALAGSLNPTYIVKNRLQAQEQPQAKINDILANKVVEFELGSAVLTPVGRAVLDEVIPVLLALDTKTKVQVVGHTDASGSQPANLALSQIRANAVRAYLVEHKLPPASVFTVGLGSDKSLFSNDTPEGRAKNRRIEFEILN